MKADIIVGVLLSATIHGGILFASYFTKKTVAAVVEEEEEPVIEIMQMPIIEPDEPDLPPDEAPPEEIEYVPPQQADVPTASIDSSFTQQIQPPPPSMQRPSGQMSIPAITNTAQAASGMKDLFDLANLDQVPQPRYQAQPQYPFEMRRAGIAGEVVVGFIVDSEGKTVEVHAVRSTQREFEAAAIQAVSKWTFRPGRKGGRAVNTRMQVPIVFSLNDR
ncbi:hypothetical protein MASR2M8_09490 [Opitutaceae bacterium]